VQAGVNARSVLRSLIGQEASTVSGRPNRVLRLDGDYVIVRKENAYVPFDNEIVVSIIGGLANIKRFMRDTLNGRILLLPDSYRNKDFAPIIISEDDDFQMEAKVVDVIKGISH